MIMIMIAEKKEGNPPLASRNVRRRESQSKEELMVSNDVMRLEVKRLRDVLNGAADDMFSLENRRQQLTMSMTERKAEIKVSDEA